MIIASTKLVNMELTVCYFWPQTVLEKLIEPPSAEAVNGAVKRLSDLGALDENVVCCCCCYVSDCILFYVVVNTHARRYKVKHGT